MLKNFLVSLILAFSFLIPPALGGENPLEKKPSPYPVSETIDRFKALLKEKGVTVFARIPHHEGAEKAGLSLRPTEVLIFGNPKIGTPLMAANQAMGIDLPLRAIAWEDETGQVWLGYLSAEKLGQRWGIAPDHPSLQTISKVLNGLSSQTVAE